MATTLLTRADTLPAITPTPKLELPCARKPLFESHGSLLDTINSHENNYNIIRFILAASVIYFHSASIAHSGHPDWISQQLWPITDLGGLAVQCFFFLSGLFVAQSIYNDGNLLDFSIKRIMRIFPGLFVCLVLTTIMLSVATHGWYFWRALAIPETYDYILSNTVLDLKWSIPTLIPDNPRTSINGSIHTLNTEVKMYVVLGVLGLVGAASRKSTIAITSLLILVAMAAVGGPVTSVLRAPPDAYAMIMMFVVGMLVFSVAERIVVTVVQGLALGGLFFLTKPVPTLHAVIFYALAIWVMLFIGQLPLLRRWLQPKVDPSYGIYIYGWPCEQLVKALVPSAKMGMVTLAALAIAYAFARFSWRYVEKPCMDMAKTITRSRASARQLLATFSGNHAWRNSFYGQVGLLAACAVMLYLTSRIDLLPVHAMSTSIVDFGPREASARTGFNVQPNGHSAMWVRLSSAPPQNTQIVVDGQRLETMTTGSNTLTAGVPTAIAGRPGNKTIYVRGISGDLILRSDPVVLKIGK
jgi:peptidoglycan/LPS O-acetylase OafA/YrhL